MRYYEDYPAAYVQFLEGGPQYGTGAPIAWDTADDEGIPDIGYLAWVRPNGDAIVAPEERVARQCATAHARLKPGSSSDEFLTPWRAVGVRVSGDGEWTFVVDAPTPGELANTPKTLPMPEDQRYQAAVQHAARIMLRTGIPDDPKCELAWLNQPEIQQQFREVWDLLGNASNAAHVTWNAAAPGTTARMTGATVTDDLAKLRTTLRQLADTLMATTELDL